MKSILILIILLASACSTATYEYQVHLRDGDGTMHLYTAEDKPDALEYIKHYEESHGDMKLIKFKKN